MRPADVHGLGAGATLGLEPDELAMIAALRTRMTRSPAQVNRAFETDAELLDLGTAELLAVTMDTLNSGAELATAPIPYEKGWLTTTVSISDLAAVGARPFVVLVSCCLPHGQWTTEDANEFGKGASEAAELHGCHIAGGDTNWANEESFTSCAIGLVPRDRFLSRLGAQAGDLLCVTGPVGAGNAAGFRNTAVGRSPGEPPWLPVARSSAVEPLREHARACIDTSDGLLSAAVTLAEAAGLGLEIDGDAEIYLPSAGELADASGLPRWLLTAGAWGEYELLYAVPPGAERGCQRALEARGMAPVRVGRLTAGPALWLRGDDGTRWDARELLPKIRAIAADGRLPAALFELMADGRGSR